MTLVLSERPPPPPQSWSLCSRADAWQRIWKTAKITVVVAATTAILQFHRDQPGMEYAYFIGPIKLCKKKKRNIPGIQLYTRESCSAYALSNAEGALISPKWTAKGIYWECPSDCENYKFSPQECPECHLDRNWTDILPVGNTKGNTNMKMRLPFRLYPTLKKLLELHFEVKINLP